MTVTEIAKALDCKVFCAPDGEREVTGGYAGDLLSWVMGRAEEGNVWATIMTNVNVVAVASLVGVSLVVICDESEIDGEVIAKAEEKSVNIVRTSMPMYEFCATLSNHLI